MYTCVDDPTPPRRLLADGALPRLPGARRQGSCSSPDICMNMSISISIYLSISLSLYIYICMCVYIYICIYIYYV